MTRPDNSTDDDDEPSDRSSSLRDLAESTRHRRSDAGSNSSGLDIDLKTASEYEAEDYEFTDPDDLLDQAEWRLPPELDDCSNFLLLGPLRGAEADRCCTNLLSGVAADPANVLFVTLTRSVDDRLETWRRNVETPPGKMTILSLGDQTRRSGVTETVTVKDDPGDVVITSLADPSDLTRLGITLTEQLSALPDEGTGSAICVHSLTSLLQYVDARRLFRFLLILQKKVETTGAVAHYHMDPDSHDQQTVSVFKSLFETVVRMTDDGDVEVLSTKN